MYINKKLAAWALAAMNSLSPDKEHEPLAEAIDRVVAVNPPLFEKDFSKKKTVALLIAVNFREGSLIPSIKGDKDRKGNFTSFCSMQINLPFSIKTVEGWDGEDLAEDPWKCISVGFRMIRESMRICPRYPVAFYASGPGACTNTRSQRISNDRMFLANRLVKEVEWPKDEDASEQSPIWPIPPPLFTPRMFWDSDN